MCNEEKLAQHVLAMSRNQAFFRDVTLIIAFEAKTPCSTAPYRWHTEGYLTYTSRWLIYWEISRDILYMYIYIYIYIYILLLLLLSLLLFKKKTSLSSLLLLLLLYIILFYMILCICYIYYIKYYILYIKYYILYIIYYVIYIIYCILYIIYYIPYITCLYIFSIYPRCIARVLWQMWIFTVMSERSLVLSDSNLWIYEVRTPSDVFSIEKSAGEGMRFRVIIRDSRGIWESDFHLERKVSCHLSCHKATAWANELDLVWWNKAETNWELRHQTCGKGDSNRAASLRRAFGGPFASGQCKQ